MELAKGDVVWQLYEPSEAERSASSKWQCLFDRPEQWLDCRAAKAKGVALSSWGFTGIHRDTEHLCRLYPIESPGCFLLDSRYCILGIHGELRSGQFQIPRF